MKKNPQWWEEDGGYYTPDYYRKTSGNYSLESVKAQVDFFERVLGLSKSATLLDVGCGIGHVSLELTKRGYCATGIDINRFFLRSAKDASLLAGVYPRFLRADMRNIPFRDTEFDTVFSTGPSVGHFSDEADNEKVFEEMTRVLHPGGVLLVHQWTLGKQATEQRSWEEELPSGEKVKWTSWNENGRVHVVEEHGGKRFEINYRMYTDNDLASLMVRFGLRVRSIHWLDYWCFNEVSKDDAIQLFVVAEK